MNGFRSGCERVSTSRCRTCVILVTGYRAILLAILLTSLPGLRPAHAQERYIYWIGAINEEQTVGDTIFRYSLDSGVIDTLVHGPSLEPDPNHQRYFYYLAIDTVRRHIYWTDSGGTNSEEEVDIGAIMRASLDGDSTETILGGITCGLGGPSDIEIDVAGNTLYWGEASECYDYALNKVDLGSTPSEEWNLLPVSRGYVVEGIELDIYNQ